MNDKTEQSLADALRCTAAGGRAEIINVPGYPLMVRAVDYNTLRADLDRAIVNFGDAAATVCDMRTQLAEAQKDAERWRRAAHCVRLDQFGGFVVTPDEPALDSDISLAFTREIDAAIDAAKGESNGTR